MPASLIKTITFGIIADSHIPDRARKLPEGLLDRLQNAHVDQILHAGDASCWRVVRQLESIAPVTIVQGNRDWFLGMRTKQFQTLFVNHVRITLAHGHRSMCHYLVDKCAYLRHGYIFERYYQILAQDYPDSDIIIFGHTHHQTAKWVNDQLVFNPGAAYPCRYNRYQSQFGLLSITPEGHIRTEFLSLK